METTTTKERPHRYFAVVELDVGEGKTQIATMKAYRQTELKKALNTVALVRIINVFRGKQLDVGKKEIVTFK